MEVIVSLQAFNAFHCSLNGLVIPGNVILISSKEQGLKDLSEKITF